MNPWFTGMMVPAGNSPYCRSEPKIYDPRHVIDLGMCTARGMLTSRTWGSMNGSICRSHLGDIWGLSHSSDQSHPLHGPVKGNHGEISNFTPRHEFRYLSISHTRRNKHIHLVVFADICRW